MNVVTEYNENNFNDAISLLLAKHTKLAENKSVIYEGNKIIASIGEKSLTVPHDTKYLDEGVYEAFDILVLIKYRGDQKTAFNHLIYVQENQLPYVRVGIDYFKRIRTIDRFDIQRTSLKKWNRQELKDELGKDFHMMVAKYDDFTIIPNNINYKGANGNMFNLYAQFPHVPYDGPVDAKKHLKWTRILMRHIFGKQIDLGLHYMKVMYEDPMQQLPILALISEERQTGKSTFVDWIGQIYGENMVQINPEDITSSFNGSYATKNVIAIEESKFENSHALEKLKALATQKKISVNQKFIGHYSIPFFGKIIMTSNDETKFVKIDQDEIRYWARKVPAFDKRNTNYEILNDLRDEIPYFLKYLIDIPKRKYKSRMVFTKKEIETSVLRAVKKESYTWLYHELYDKFEDHFNNSVDETIEFTALDIKDKWYSKNNSVPTSFIRKVLNGEFRLFYGKNRKYNPFTDESAFKKVKTGAAYTLDKTFFNLDPVSEEEKPSIDTNDVLF